MKTIELSDQQIYRLNETITIRLNTVRNILRGRRCGPLIKEALEVEEHELKFIQQKLKDARG